MEGYDAGAEQVGTPEQLTEEELRNIGQEAMRAAKIVQEGKLDSSEATTELTEETDLILPPEPQPEANSAPSETPLNDFAEQTPTEPQPETGNPAEQIRDAFHDAGFNQDNQ